jgi:hypothetical protein
VALGEQLRGVAGPATEIDDPSARVAGDAREKLRRGATPLGFEASVRSGVPIVHEVAYNEQNAEKFSTRFLATKLQHNCDCPYGIRANMKMSNFTKR